MTEWLQWDIVYRDGNAAPAGPLAVRTFAPALDSAVLPLEIGVLLPTTSGTKPLINAVVVSGNFPAEYALGLFLANPMLNCVVDGERLLSAGVRWVANLPSVEQHDALFAQQLSDVKLDHRQEFLHLAQLKKLGLKVAAVVAGPDALPAALPLVPDALIVMPKVADFAAGFPSLTQRRTTLDKVRDAADRAHWRGPLLCFAEQREADHHVLWPEGAHGVMCRPRLL